MPRPRPSSGRPSSRSAAHQAVVDRRLELLSAELTRIRGSDDGWPAPDTHTRVRLPAEGWPAEADLEPPGPDPAPPPPLPDPGRHASRRWTVGPPHLAAVLAAALLALGVAGWWWLSARSHEPQPVAPAPLSPVSLTPASGGGEGTPTASGAGDGEVTVDVEGKVRRPGIVVLPAGSRVVDALEAAGGARPRADVSTLNLARLLVDGEQVVVGLPAPSGLPSVAASGLPPAAGALVNLNTASQTELEGLPEVGPVTAQSIIAWRDEHGGFTAVDELLEVDGIGDATLEKLLPYVTV